MISLFGSTIILKVSAVSNKSDTFKNVREHFKLYFSVHHFKKGGRRGRGQ